MSSKSKDVSTISDSLKINEGTFLFYNDFDPDPCRECMEWLLFHAKQKTTSTSKTKSNKKDLNYLKLYINSPGGDVVGALGIVDLISCMKLPVHTLAFGESCSAALITLAGGKKGHRYISENTILMSHQFNWATEGKQHDLEAWHRGVNIMKDAMLEYYEKVTGLSQKEIKKHLLSPTDKWLTPEEVISFGLADKIIKNI